MDNSLENFIPPYHIGSLLVLVNDFGGMYGFLSSDNKKNKKIHYIGELRRVNILRLHSGAMTLESTLAPYSFCLHLKQWLSCHMGLQNFFSPAPDGGDWGGPTDGWEALLPCFRSPPKREDQVAFGPDSETIQVNFFPIFAGTQRPNSPKSFPSFGFAVKPS